MLGNWPTGGGLEHRSHGLITPLKPKSFVVFDSDYWHSTEPFPTGTRYLLSGHLQTPVVNAFRKHRELWDALNGRWGVDIQPKEFKKVLARHVGDKQFRDPTRGPYIQDDGEGFRDGDRYNDTEVEIVQTVAGQWRPRKVEVIGLRTRRLEHR